MPACSARAGKRTSTRSPAGTLTRWPAPAPSSTPVARIATSTVIADSVWLCTTTGSSTSSPKLRKRGGEGRTISGSRAVTVDSALPKWRSPCTATAVMR